MTARAVDPETQRQRARDLSAWHDEWSGQQIADGVDGPVPDDRPDPSDYNQHYPDMEADGAAQDEFHTRARQIMGLPPLTE